MASSPTSAPAAEWFRDLLDTADDVYFRYSLIPARGFVYLSPSILALTGHAPQAFIDNPALCLGVIARDERRVLRQILRARRGLSATLHIVRDGAKLGVAVRTVAVTRGRRVVAVEGVLRPTQSTGADGARPSMPVADSTDGTPTPQRLAALMYEVHALLHRVLPDHEQRLQGTGRQVIQLGELTLDLDRLTVTERGRAVSLTSRELMVLRYLLTRPGRIVTREQLLTDVWGYRYTGDDRTIDVHISRLRRKLPSLASRLVAVKHVGYRLEPDDERAANVANS